MARYFTGLNLLLEFANIPPGNPMNLILTWDEPALDVFKSKNGALAQIIEAEVDGCPTDDDEAFFSDLYEERGCDD